MVTLLINLNLGSKFFFLNRLFLTRRLPKRSQMCKIQDSNERTNHRDVENRWNGCTNLSIQKLSTEMYLLSGQDQSH